MIHRLQTCYNDLQCESEESELKTVGDWLDVGYPHRAMLDRVKGKPRQISSGSKERIQWHTFTHTYTIWQVSVLLLIVSEVIPIEMKWRLNKEWPTNPGLQHEPLRYRFPKCLESYQARLEDELHLDHHHQKKKKNQLLLKVEKINKSSTTYVS